MRPIPFHNRTRLFTLVIKPLPVAHNLPLRILYTVANNLGLSAHRAFAFGPTHFHVLSEDPWNSCSLSRLWTDCYWLLSPIYSIMAGLFLFVRILSHVPFFGGGAWSNRGLLSFWRCTCSLSFFTTCLVLRSRSFSLPRVRCLGIELVFTSSPYSRYV